MTLSHVLEWVAWQFRSRATIVDGASEPRFAYSGGAVAVDARVTLGEVG